MADRTASPRAERPPCYHKAIDLLALRGHFRAELGAKLERRGYERSEVEVTLDRLADEDLLDDARQARVFVAERLRRGPRGRMKLLAELRQRGVDGSVAQAAVDAELEGDVEEEAVRAAAERWLRRGKRDPQALARHLAGRGFGRGLVMGTVRGLIDDERLDPNLYG